MTFQRIPSFVLGTALGLCLSISSVSAAPSTVLSQTPLFVSEAVPPLVMLVLGKDHSLFFEAYNDASDLNGDGNLDLQFNPGLEYYGLYDSTLCYSHSGSGNSGLFSPVGRTSKVAAYACTNAWSGNWLNYVTTSRIDALRKVLYGGHRETDTAMKTVLRRAYIPQDGHSWAKEYTSTSTNGYDITRYTTLSKPTQGKRHFFGNVTMAAGTNCATLDNCSNLPPLLSVVRNSSARVWDWASSESPVLNNNTHAGTRDNYTVRVEVCTADYHDNDCRNYSGNYKPVGLLHQYVDDSMLFGLMTGSYDQNMSGGVLRKVVSAFSSEINANGTFNLSSNSIVKNLDRLRIRDYNNGKTNSTYRNTSYRTGIMQQGHYVDWGNPIGEMMYETVRYLASKGTPTSAFTTSKVHDDAVGLDRANWDDPYSTRSAANAQSCAKPNMLVMSNVNTSYDSDQVPGSYFGSFSGDLSGLNVSAEATAITAAEGLTGKTFFIGESGDSSDFAPTAKTVASLAQIRGLSPIEPTKQGSYYPASIARFGANTVVNPASDQKTDTYVVALASPLPTFEFKVGNQTISLAPFAKTINGISADRTKGRYQPTDPIVDIYVEEYSETGAKFRINYEADEQGNDFDSDVIVEYVVSVANNALTVQVTPTAESTGSNQNLGYAISGTNRDGVYLVVQDKKNSLPYFLNVPPGRDAGYCNVTNMPAACGQLPWINGTGTLNGLSASSSTQSFSASSGDAAGTLQSPLWYAAKYGIAGRATSSISGDPDNYFLVTNASSLKSQLEAALNKIMQVNSSVTSPTISSEAAQDNSVSDGVHTYTTNFDVDGWSGDLKKINTNTGETVWQASSTITTSNRKVYFADDSGELASFEWGNLTDAQKISLNREASGTSDSLGQARVDFIRGTNTSFRNRTSLLGDIINSSPLLVAGADYSIARANSLEGSSSYSAFKSAQEAKPKVLYVGANDGMLHALNASTGAEMFAFIPKAVIPNLPALTASDYGAEGGTEHQYFVDGSPVARDVYFDGAWHKVLLGSLGAGGREIFALDITDPENPSLLWEFTNSDDRDLGYTVPQPNIARLHNGKWAALIPNGYESGNSFNAVLFILDIETGEVIKKIVATPTLSDSESTGTLGNGLSRVTDSDFNGDGIADYAYAGDLLGNVWRFDLLDTSSETPFLSTATKDQFSVSFGGKPLYVARTSAGVRQSITAAPTLLRHPTSTGYLTIFGTGRYLTVTDKSSTQQQSLYAIWDRKTAGEATTTSLTMAKDRNDLTQQTLTEATFNGSSVFTVSNNAVTWYDESGSDDSDVQKWGWYLDFTQSGERLIYNLDLYGNTLVLATVTPSDDPCFAGMTGAVYGLNPKTGGATRYATFDLDGDGTYDGGYAGFVMDGGDFSLSGGKIYVNDKEGGTSETPLNAGISEGRQTWRQLTTEEE